jgi:excinuclease ABC subunit B
VVKRIKDIIDGVYDQDDVARELKVAEEQARFEVMSEKDLSREINRIEKEMIEHAKNLEFEQAAAARDRLFKLRNGAFGA